MNWFPREYLALVGLGMWGAIMFSIYKTAELMERRAEHRATAAREARPESAE